MKPNTAAFENKARQIFSKVFSDYVELNSGSVDKSVYLPKNDTGRWEPRSLLIVNHEHGIPGKMDYEVNVFDKWEAVEKQLSEAIGRDVFFEPINYAVSALWYLDIH